MKIYVVGSHSTGKTTFARWISKHYSLPLVAEVARQVLAEMELPLDVLRVDLDRTLKFQAEVFRRQAAAEDTAGDLFVSDRAFDNLAYAAQHTLGLSSLARSAASYASRLRGPNVVVFFLRPNRALLAEDGTREIPVWEEMLRIDGMVKLLLELHDVDYVSVDTLNMAERARTVRAVLAARKVDPVDQVPGVDHGSAEDQPLGELVVRPRGSAHAPTSVCPSTH